MGDHDAKGHDAASNFAFNVVLLADVLYNGLMVEFCCKTLRRIVPMCSEATDEEHIAVLIVFVDRTSEGGQGELDALSRAGFTCERRWNLSALECTRSFFEEPGHDHLDGINVWLWKCVRTGLGTGGKGERGIRP